MLQKLKSLTFNKKSEEEIKAINKIKSDPKFFYSYAKKFAKTKQYIPQLFDKNGIIKTGRKEIADQFVSAFSDPNNPTKKLPSSKFPTSLLSDFSFDVKNMINAIDEIDPNSACPDFSIPAKVLKNCKLSLAYPLFLMWKESLSTGVVPQFYKKQLITPIYKKGSKAVGANYRPVSLTAHEVKIFERIIRNKIMDFLEANSSLSINQHGFRKGRSCLTQLLKHQQFILRNLLENNETDSIFLDFAKAFDKVDLQILFKKLKNIGISGTLLKWITDFLTERTQVVSVDGFLSYIANVLSGVPQGTVLGPLLFLIFVNDMEDYIQFSKISLFADDSSKSISTCQDTVLLQEDLYRLTQWSSINNMTLHEDNFLYVNYNILNKKSLLENLPFFNVNSKYLTSKGNILEPCNTVCDLGITFSPDLTWTSHISLITQSARRKSGWVLTYSKINLLM